MKASSLKRKSKFPFMEEWKEYKLGEISTFSQGIQVDIDKQYSDYKPGRVRFIRIVDFTRNDEPIRFIDKPRDKCLTEDGDIVMIRYGSQTAGLVAISYDGAIANNIFKITFNNAVVSNEFGYYYLSQKSIFDFLRGAQSSSTMPAITFEIASRVPLSLPPIKEQERITKILKSLDDKIEVNRRINENLEQQAQALFKSWFVDFEPFKDQPFVESELGSIPQGWHVGDLFDVAEILDKYRKPLSGKDRESMDKIYPYYGATSCMDYVDNYIFDGIYTLIGEDGSVAKEDGLPYMQYVWGKLWVNNHAHILQGKNGFSTEMLHAMLSITNIQHLVTGAVQAKLSQANMKKILVAIPPVAVLDKVRPAIDALYEIKRNKEDESRRLAELRDTLLPRLMSGELHVNDM